MRNEDRLRALDAYADQGKWWALRVLEVDESVLFQGRSSTAGDILERWLTEKDVPRDAAEASATPQCALATSTGHEQ